MGFDGKQQDSKDRLFIVLLILPVIIFLFKTDKFGSEKTSPFLDGGRVPHSQILDFFTPTFSPQFSIISFILTTLLEMAKAAGKGEGRCEGCTSNGQSLKPCPFLLISIYFQEFIMFQQGRMSQNQSENLKKYDTISLENRKTLVRLVVEQERSISKSAKKLGIKLSTAKLIIKKFKESGTYFQRKSDKINRQRIESKLQERNRNDLWGEGNNALPMDSYSPSQVVYAADLQGNYPLVAVSEPPVYLFNFYPPQMYWV